MTFSTAPPNGLGALPGAMPGAELKAGEPLHPATFADIRRQAMLDGCKWDPQVGDHETLAPFPLMMSTSAWRKLAAQAEALSREALTAEAEIAQRPDLLNRLGLPRALRKVLGGSEELTPTAARVIRFDFHPTTQGWKISEANSDVPGGYSEACHFTTLMAEHFSGWRPSGDPAGELVAALSAVAGSAGPVALLSAPGYLEDHQVVAYLSQRLRELGCPTRRAKPEQLRWRDGPARLELAGWQGPVGAVVRFYQAEWLARLPVRMGWSAFFRGGQTPVTNPALAVISESKRFPLVWDELETKLPTWRSLLPESRDPRAVNWGREDGWLLKTAYCNTGDTVSAREWLSGGAWARARLAGALFPGHWVAQRRFESLPVATPMGARHVCLGVYTVNGRAAGAYARMAARPLIDFAATDVALLLEDDE